MSAERPTSSLGFSDDGPQRWLRYVGVSRIGVLSFITVGGAFFRVAWGSDALLFLYAFGYLTSIHYLYTLHRHKKVSAKQAWAQVLVDFSMVAATVAFTQGPTSFFAFIFVVVVLEAGLLLGLSQGFVISTLASVFMLIQTIFPPQTVSSITTFELWYSFLVQCLAFYLTAFISGFWNQRIYRLQQFQKEILDNMNSGFLITDATGIVTLQNNATAEILGIEPLESVGRHVSEVLRVSSDGECPIVTALRSGRDFTSYEFTAITAEGISTLLGLTTNRITDKDGMLTGMIASFIDLTEMNMMRQELRRQDRMAVIGELAAGLAHEIRNPVTVIRGALDELRSMKHDIALQEKLQRMAIRESDHLNDIVSGFLDFAREPKMKRETINVQALVEDVIAILERDCDNGQSPLIVFECPDAPCEISGDVSKIKQVFVNLGKNAIEAMDGTGTLHIGVTDSEGPVEIRFEDEGPGIEPDKVARIFEPFYTTKSSGVGMGLAVCLRIVTAHDGTLRATSHERGGCTMIVRLPHAQSEE